ncbi:MAG: VTT domain-containing protein [Nanoarchaeota archaeon]
MIPLNLLIEAFAPYKILLLILGSIYPGEEAIILFSVLAGQGLISLPDVVVIGALGILLVDNLIFWLAKSRMSTRIKRWRIFSKKSQRLSIIMHKLHKESPFLMLFITKFVYGMRHISVFYLSLKGMTWKRFFLYDVGAFALWGIIMIPLAWLAARGFTVGLHIATRIERILLIGVLVALVFYLLEWVIRNWIMKPKFN